MILNSGLRLPEIRYYTDQHWRPVRDQPGVQFGHASSYARDLKDFWPSICSPTMRPACPCGDMNLTLHGLRLRSGTALDRRFFLRLVLAITLLLLVGLPGMAGSATVAAANIDAGRAGSTAEVWSGVLNVTDCNRMHPQTPSHYQRRRPPPSRSSG